MVNDIIDPYYDWPLDQSVFDEFIVKKYGSLSNAYNMANSLYYNNSNYSYLMTSTTYNNVTEGERTGWAPISNYDYEFGLNEAKRQIKLLDRSIAVDVSFELEKTLKRVNKV